MQVCNIQEMEWKWNSWNQNGPRSMDQHYYSSTSTKTYKCEITVTSRTTTITLEHGQTVDVQQTANQPVTVQVPVQIRNEQQLENKEDNSSSHIEMNSSDKGIINDTDRREWRHIGVKVTDSNRSSDSIDGKQSNVAIQHQQGLHRHLRYTSVWSKQLKVYQKKDLTNKGGIKMLSSKELCKDSLKKTTFISRIPKRNQNNNILKVSRTTDKDNEDTNFDHCTSAKRLELLKDDTDEEPRHSYPAPFTRRGSTDLLLEEAKQAYIDQTESLHYFQTIEQASRYTDMATASDEDTQCSDIFSDESRSSYSPFDLSEQTEDSEPRHIIPKLYYKSERIELLSEKRITPEGLADLIMIQDGVEASANQKVATESLERVPTFIQANEVMVRCNT